MKGGIDLKIDGAVYNGLSEQYMDAMQYDTNPKKKEMKSTFFWVMSLISMNYWEYRGRIPIDVQLLANQEEMSVLFNTTLINRLYKRTFGGMFSHDEIEEMLKMIVEAFNYTDGLVQSHFHADGPQIYGRVNW